MQLIKACWLCLPMLAKASQHILVLLVASRMGGSACKSVTLEVWRGTTVGSSR